MVRTHPDPPFIGGVAQLGERLLCKQEVIGSIPFTSTIPRKIQSLVLSAHGQGGYSAEHSALCQG